MSGEMSGSGSCCRPSWSVSRRIMAENLTSRLLKEHLVGGRLAPGDQVELRVDQALLQDATGTMACLQLEQFGQMTLGKDEGGRMKDESSPTERQPLDS